MVRYGKVANAAGVTAREMAEAAAPAELPAGMSELELATPLPADKPARSNSELPHVLKALAVEGGGTLAQMPLASG